jgi:hypothetical protein
MKFGDGREKAWSVGAACFARPADPEENVTGSYFSRSGFLRGGAWTEPLSGCFSFSSSLPFRFHSLSRHRHLQAPISNYLTESARSTSGAAKSRSRSHNPWRRGESDRAGDVPTITPLTPFGFDWRRLDRQVELAAFL